VLLELDKRFVVLAATMGAKFKPPDAIPFTVEVKVAPLSVIAFVFIAGAVEVMPLMLDVIIFAALVNVLLLMIFTPVA